MSILIKGMDMPQNCQNCMDANLNIAISLFGAMCPFCEKIFVADINIRKQRHPDCPLIELPPHGNLKDESDIISLIEVMFCEDKEGMECAIQCVKDVDTIIEAEGSET